MFVYLFRDVFEISENFIRIKLCVTKMNTIRLFARRMSNNNKCWEPLKKVGIIGVPFEKGQKKYGVSVAPAAIRDGGLIEQLQEIGMINYIFYIRVFLATILSVMMIILIKHTIVMAAMLMPSNK